MKSEVRSQKSEAASGFAEAGFEIIEKILPEEKCDTLAGELSELFESEKKSSRRKIGGVRNLLQESPSVSEVASSPELKGFLERFLGKPAFPVRAIFFDKNSDSNWRVTWHQDLTLAVKERIETPGFTTWTIKDGVNHVQPPTEILQGMATIRVHLDDCGADNGALKIISGSHSQGKLNATEIADWVQKEGAIVCEAVKGAALLMRPLLLHSSSPAKTPLHRRVLHIEYATAELPNGLKWFDRL